MHPVIAVDGSIENPATGDLSKAADRECLQYECPPRLFLHQFRSQQAFQCSPDIIHNFVDDAVATDLDILLSCQAHRPVFSNHMEGDDNRIGSGCEIDITLVHTANTFVQDFHPDFRMLKLVDFAANCFQ